MNHSQNQDLSPPVWSHVHFCDCNWHVIWWTRIDFSDIITQALVFPSGEIHRLGRMSACEYVCVSDCPSRLLIGHPDRLRRQLLGCCGCDLSTEAKTSFLVLMATLQCDALKWVGEKTKSEIMRIKDVLDILRKLFLNDHTYRSDWDWSIMEKYIKEVWKVLALCSGASYVFYRTFE